MAYSYSGEAKKLRLKCLKEARKFHQSKAGSDSDTVLRTTKKFYELVTGEKER